MPRSSTRRSESGSAAYEARLDPEIRAFIARTNAWYPPETLGLPIEKQRDIYHAMCRAFHCGTPDGVGSSDSVIALPDRRLRIRRYCMVGQEPAAAILYYHGGGSVLGDLDSHDDVCAALCAGTAYDVISGRLPAGAGTPTSRRLRRCLRNLRLGGVGVPAAAAALRRERPRKSGGGRRPCAARSSARREAMLSVGHEGLDSPKRSGAGAPLEGGTVWAVRPRGVASNVSNNRQGGPS
jgi:hypothetical protein